jgi:hypothetical protein
MRKHPPKRTKAKRASSRRPRRKLVPISEEMRHWSAVLEAELVSWPTTSKPMFGFQSFYRESRIFAAIPRSRGFGTAYSFMVKFDSMPPALFQRAKNESRLDTSTRVPGKGWFGFELSSGDDLRDAIWWLSQAYECAGK